MLATTHEHVHVPLVPMIQAAVETLSQALALEKEWLDATIAERVAHFGGLAQEPCRALGLSSARIAQLRQQRGRQDRDRPRVTLDLSEPGKQLVMTNEAGESIRVEILDARDCGEEGILALLERANRSDAAAVVQAPSPFAERHSTTGARAFLPPAETRCFADRSYSSLANRSRLPRAASLR